MFDTRNNYFDERNITKIKVDIKEVSAQEAADFYKTHLDDFKKSIVDTGDIIVLGTQSRWFVYPDWRTNEFKIYCKFTLNGFGHTIDEKLCLSDINHANMVDIRDKLQETVVAALTKTIRNAILKDGVEIIYDGLKEYRKPY